MGEGWREACGEALSTGAREKLTARPGPAAPEDEGKNGVPPSLTQLSETLRAESPGTPHPPHAIGPTASLMHAIQTDGLPETDGYDNLQTLRVVEAAYLSAAEHRSVRLDECLAVPCPD